MKNKNISILIRKAKAEDSQDIWLWRNDIVTRQYSVSAKQISWGVHKKWFSRVLKNKKQKFYLAIQKTNKVGVIRTNTTMQGVIELNINLNPAFRGKGFGYAFLSRISNELKRKYPSAIQKAIIKKRNKPSQNVFRACGFIPFNEIQSANLEIWLKI